MPTTPTTDQEKKTTLAQQSDIDLIKKAAPSIKEYSVENILYNVTYSMSYAQNYVKSHDVGKTIYDQILGEQMGNNLVRALSDLYKLFNEKGNIEVTNAVIRLAESLGSHVNNSFMDSAKIPRPETPAPGPKYKFTRE